jgi:hypothetical protein
MPVYHSGKLSKTDRPDYNYPLRPTTPDLTLPFAPRNPMVTSPYSSGAWDIRWDNPKIIPSNSTLQILGCNVYRATDSPYGPYVLVNDTPVNVLFFRDQTLEQLVTQENATPSLRYNLEPDKRWVIYTQNKPIVTPNSNGKTSLRIQDVQVEIDDGDGIFLAMPAFSVNGVDGEIELISYPVFSDQVQQIIPPRLPVPPNGRVRVTYRYLRHSVLSNLNQRIYYKVTTVAVNPDDPSAIIETPLEEISARSGYDIEMLDYIWREAILRNRWILEQGGERVKLFIRKWMGQKCSNYQYSYGQSHNTCTLCYGTNIIGGYVGPYDAIIAPPETEKQIELMDMGLHMRYDWETWMSDYPLINPRDFVVRQNNERYLIGPVNPQGQRGAIFQQHFSMSYIDTGDIRYQVPITGGETSVPASYDPYRQTAPTNASPAINDKPEIPKERIIRGRTVTFEGITY